MSLSQKTLQDDKPRLQGLLDQLALPGLLELLQQLPKIMDTQQLILESLKSVKLELLEIKAAQNLSTDLQDKTTQFVCDLTQTAASTTLNLQKITDFNSNLIESEMLREECQKINSGIYLQWSNQLNTRKNTFGIMKRTNRNQNYI